MEKQKRNKIIALSIVFIILTITCFFADLINYFISVTLKNKFNVFEAENNLIVHFIDVGQGDAIAINLPNNETLLIDTGPEFVNVKYSKYIKEKVLNSKNNLTIDYLLLTHADSDHIGGALKILHTFDVKKVFMPAVEGSSNTFDETFSYIKNNIDYEVVSALTKLEIEGCEIDIFSLEESNDTNTASTIVKLTYLNKTFLFMADADFETEEYLVDKYDLNCDVLKIAHHGSKDSSSEEFLKLATPEYSIISVGNNAYGHPGEEVLNKLQDVDSKILRTDINGNIVFVVSKDYDMFYVFNNFIIVNKFLDYRIVVLILDALIFMLIVKILVKKTKKIAN